MLEGKCKECGARYHGLAMQYRRNQSCPKCGGALYIYWYGQLIAEGYPLFTAEKFFINVNFDKETVENN